VGRRGPQSNHRVLEKSKKSVHSSRNWGPERIMRSVNGVSHSTSSGTCKRAITRHPGKRYLRPPSLQLERSKGRDSSLAKTGRFDRCSWSDDVTYSVAFLMHLHMKGKEPLLREKEVPKSAMERESYRKRVGRLSGSNKHTEELAFKKASRASQITGREGPPSRSEAQTRATEARFYGAYKRAKAKS